MADLIPGIAEHRATILVGYGAFGRDVLRRLLTSAAPRGALRWEVQAGGVAPDERHLQDLGLLWVPDRTVVASHDGREGADGSASEMMRDLFDQIRTVGEPSDEMFEREISGAADLLLASAGRAERDDPLPLGLDVIVLARPTDRETLGTLDRLLVRGMDALANHANLRRAVRTGAVLNYISIFDFENYWDNSGNGQAIRRAVHGSVQQWERRRSAQRPSFGRFYLVDGHTADGTRSAAVRIDETSLFLEFLLFEGHRAGDLKRIYEPLPTESPVATFGIRLFERSAGLLKYLAAARFGVGWLEYLCGRGSSASKETSALHQLLSKYRPEKIDALLDAPALRSKADRELVAIEEDLARISVDLPDWPQQIRERYSEAMERLRSNLSAAAHERLAEVVAGSLAHFGDELRVAVEADLHHATTPLTAGDVLAILDDSLRALNQLPETQPPSPSDDEGVFRRVTELHAAYRRFHADRVDVEGLKWWWPLLAVTLAAGLTPMLHELLSDIPRPDAMQFLLDRAYSLLQSANRPAVLGTLLFAAGWGIGGLGVQRGIERRIERARRFYTDYRQGRFIDRLRSGLTSGGALRHVIDRHVDRVLIEMERSARDVAIRELTRVRDRIRERCREMSWLSGQLRDFLRMNGIRREDLTPDDGKLVRSTTGIRYTLESGEDLQAMMRSNQPTEGRFRSAQIDRKPLQDWDERYSSEFLTPLDFAGRLAREYRDPYEQELTQPGVGPHQQRLIDELRRFLTRRFHPAFQFHMQDGLPPERHYGLLPSLWRQFFDVRTSFSALRIDEASTIPTNDTGRLYLLWLQTGVEPGCLTGSP